MPEFFFQIGADPLNDLYYCRENLLGLAGFRCVLYTLKSLFSQVLPHLRALVFRSKQICFVLFLFPRRINISPLVFFVVLFNNQTGRFIRIISPENIQ